MPAQLYLISALVLAGGVLAIKSPDDVGKLPALGWNSWNAYACDISEDKILSAAQFMISNGYKTAGYEYVNIDDCWAVQSGRDANTNQIIPDPEKFPDGIDGLAKKIHDMGLKIGIYSSAGTETCQSYPASIFYEDIDAATFAAWGIDYLKYDNCNIPSNMTDQYTFCVPDGSGIYPNGTCLPYVGEPPANYDWSTSNSAIRYKRMGDALRAQNRTILYSLCEWGTADVQAWGNTTAASWRSTGDITATWSRVAEILNENSFYLNNVGFWGHSDPDMLELGNGDLTLQESRSHFALWALMKAPLIIGTDLSKLDAQLQAVLQNKYLLAFNQDTTYGGPATPYSWNWKFNSKSPAPLWSGLSSQGVMVAMLNAQGQSAKQTAIWGNVGYGLKAEASYQVTDVWTGKNLGCVANEYSEMVASHDTAVLLVGAPCNNTAAPGGKRWSA